MNDTNAMQARCIETLRSNDQGRSTIPSAQLYPHQWNWDSAFAAIGWMHVDPARAVTELESLLSAQWAGGMVPHIAFHPDHEHYEPGPHQWGTIGAPGAPEGRSTTSITQPPVAATAARAVLEHAGESVADRIAALLPALEAWHAWFADTRELVAGHGAAIVHPWESGMDNAPRWDGPLAAVPSDEPIGFVRADTSRADPATRPSDTDYRRYMYLVRHITRSGFDLAEAARTSPLRVACVSTTALLHRAEEDLAWLADQLGVNGIDAGARLQRWTDALQGPLWTPSGFRDRDLVTGSVIDVEGAYELVPLCCSAPTEAQVARVVERLSTRYAAPWPVPTMPTNAEPFNGRLYWRGPTWLNVNWLIARGLAAHGHVEAAKQLAERTVALVSTHGPHEHHDPHTGEPHGARAFTWSAALALDLVRRPVG